MTLLFKLRKHTTVLDDSLLKTCSKQGYGGITGKQLLIKTVVNTSFLGSKFS